MFPAKAQLQLVRRYGGMKAQVMGRKSCSVCVGGIVGGEAGKERADDRENSSVLNGSTRLSV